MLRPLRSLGVFWLIGILNAQSPVPPVLPSGVRPLAPAEVQALLNAAEAAEGLSLHLPTYPRMLVLAGAANFRKLLPKPGAPDPRDPPRVGVQTDPARDPRTNGGITFPESIKGGKIVRTSGVGVGEECVVLGPGVFAADVARVMSLVFHEGLRTKEQSEATLPPLGPGPWVEPEEDKLLNYEQDLFVHTVDWWFYLMYMDLLNADAGATEEEKKPVRFWLKKHGEIVKACREQIQRLVGN